MKCTHPVLYAVAGGLRCQICGAVLNSAQEPPAPSVVLIPDATPDPFRLPCSTLQTAVIFSCGY